MENERKAFEDLSLAQAKAATDSYSSTSSLVPYAQIFHENNFVIVPVRGKIPTSPNWEKTIYSESLPKFERAYRSGKAENIGALTGKVSSTPLNFVVLDIDVDRQGLETWIRYIEQHGEPTTFRVRTGRGGMHYYFKYSERMNNLKNMKNILNVGWEFKTTGGQIILPGSIHPETRSMYMIMGGYTEGNINIRPIPEWIMTLLQSHEAELEGRRTGSLQQGLSQQIFQEQGSSQQTSQQQILLEQQTLMQSFASQESQSSATSSTEEPKKKPKKEDKSYYKAVITALKKLSITSDSRRGFTFHQILSEVSRTLNLDWGKVKQKNSKTRRIVEKILRGEAKKRKTIVPVGKNYKLR